jgi:TRAP-type mannitol/chloroaromatic compound transport system permease small subunit
MIVLRGIQKTIDGIAELSGVAGWLLVLYCMCFGVTDVFLRYWLNQPSLWIGTTIQAAMVLMACVGGVYAVKHDAFVKLDIFYANRSRRVQAVLDVITASFTFLFLYVLIVEGIEAAQLAYMLNQTTPTAVPIPLGPIKSAIPIAAVLVLVVVLKKFVHDLYVIVTGRPWAP